MHNKVVFHTAKALEECGYVTLRFNFRGVGASTGTHDGGRGGSEDARVALDYLLTRQPGARQVLVAGFSFGASVGLRFGCADARVHRVLRRHAGTVAQPAALAHCSKPLASSSTRGTTTSRAGPQKAARRSARSGASRCASFPARPLFELHF